jgi:YbbR domain-containing protein
MKLMPNLSGLLKKPSYTVVISVLIAVMAWFIVVNTDPNQERVVTIKNVPVNVSITALNSLGLSIIEGDDPRVSVQVRGRVIEVGNLTADDVQVQASFSDIAGAGTYELKLSATSMAGSVESISPETITMTFDRETRKELPVVVDINGLSVPENDYILGSVSATPSSVTVRGPEQQVNRIAKAVVRADLDEPLTRSQVVSSEIIFMDADGSEVTSDHITSDFTSADITIPVKRKVELPLRLSFINVPEGFPLDELTYTMSNETIVVAAQESSISNTTEIIAGVVDLEQLDLTEQSTYTFRVRLPDDFVNIENIENIVVEFDTEGLSSTYLNLSQFQVINEPADFTVTPLTQALYNVKILGPEDVLSTLQSEDFIVTIDLSDRDVQLGQYEIPVSISAPTQGKVWALGTHTVVVNIQAKTQTETGG